MQDIWTSVKDLFERASQLDTLEARTQFVHQRCGDDAQVRDQVLSLLTARRACEHDDVFSIGQQPVSARAPIASSANIACWTGWERAVAAPSTGQLALAMSSSASP